MLKSIEGNFDHPEVNELLIKHFVELRAASPEGSAHVLDISGLQVSSIKCFVRSSLTSGWSKFPSIDLSIYVKIVMWPIFRFSFISFLR